MRGGNHPEGMGMSDPQPAAAVPAGKLDFVKLLADLLARFTRVPSDRVDSEVEDAQRCVCECLGLDASSIWQWAAENSRSLRMTHTHVPPGFPPLPEKMDAEEFFPWCHSQILAGKTVVLSSLDQSPAEAARDREVFRQLGVKTNLTFPLSTGGGPSFGAMSFNDTRQERIWTDELVNLLEVVARIFAGVLARKHADLRLRESEAKLELAADSAGAGLWSLDLKASTYWLTPRCRELFGISPGETVTFERFLSLVHPADRESVQETVDALVQSKSRGFAQYRILKPGGSLRWISSRGSVRCNMLGEPDSLMGVSLDITEQKQAEAALHASESRLASAVNIAALGFYQLEEGFRVGFMDDRFRALLGIPPSEEPRTRGYWLEHLHPDDLPPVLEMSREVLEGGRNSFVAEYRYRHPREGLRWIRHLSRVQERNAAGQAMLVDGVLQDITDRKLAEEALRVREEESRATFEQAAVGMAHVGIDGRWLHVNDKLCAIVGYSRDELLQMTFQDITHPEDLQKDLNFVCQILSGEIKTYSMEKRYIRKDRTVVWINLTVSVVRQATGAPGYFISVVEDITDRKRAEEALRQSEERFRQVAETVSDFFWEIDAEGFYTYTSPSVERILGYSPDELVGKVRYYDLFAPEEFETLKTAAYEVFKAQRNFQAFSSGNLSKSGNVVDLEVSGIPILDEAGHLLGYRGAATNVTDRRRAEMETQRLRQELAHFSRIATIGELTASIAHELNQPLGAILNNAQAALHLLQRGAPDLEELQEIFQDIVADNRRAADVIRSTRSMLKNGAGELHPLSLNDLLTDMMPIVRNEALIKKISIVLDLGSSLSLVEGNRTHLQQVILNLVVNAFEAMEAVAEPRELILLTRQEEGEVVLDVSDSGPGIPADRLGSIFEPFFTTKKSGLGMGLPLSHTLVTAHKGRLWAENNPKRGITFHMALPALSDQGASAS